ncbi:hypothetical protein [Paractinoplanes toevensis]|uniref:hypothetical protein n=1 Tax=Paractinoplanes toevensis TaxID=571911 RepID=UPI001BB33566|nr:hypothetical protein [Actinoplanes toevensis]
MLGEGWSSLVVAKLYLPEKMPGNLAAIVEEATARRIGRLGARGSDDDAGAYSPLATPKAVLYPSADADKPCGLLLARVDPQRFVSFDKFLHSPLKNDLSVACLAAECLAEIVAWLHGHDYIVGDFSGTNIRVDSSGRVCLLDLDSFGIVGHPEVVPSGDTSRHYLAPETVTGEPTQDSDRFVLSMLVIQLLLQGIPPFAGVPRGRREASVQDNINHRRSWLLDPKDLILPLRARDHPGLAALPELTDLLFRRAVDKAAPRPTADEWVRELRRIRATVEPCECGGLRFAGAVCPSCKAGHVAPAPEELLSKWVYHVPPESDRHAEPEEATFRFAVPPAAVDEPERQVRGPAKTGTGRSTPTRSMSTPTRAASTRSRPEHTASTVPAWRRLVSIGAIVAAIIALIVWLVVWVAH